MAFTMTNVAQAREMVEQLRHKAERAESMAMKFRKRAQGWIGTTVRVTEVSGAAMAFGYAHGRWGENGELAVAGLPVDIGAAVLLHGAALFGGLGAYAEHGHNLGNGALAAYAYRTGAQIGAAAASRSLEAAAALHAPGAAAGAAWMLPAQPAPSHQPLNVQALFPSSPFGG